MLSDLNPEMRIDAEYYRAEILIRINILDKKNNVTLDKLVDFIVGPFGSTVTVDKYVDKSDFRYVRNKDINDFVITNNESALVPESVYSSLGQFHIREYDLLLTVVGTLGKAAIALKKDTKSIFSCKSTLLRAKTVNPYYLLTYLNSPTGQLFILRGKRGVIQEGLNLFDLKEIKVYLPKENFQEYIGNLVKDSFSMSEKYQYLFNQAQTLLLSELGLLDWKPKHRLSFVKNYSETQQAGRFDAEYFQPKYDEIVAAIKNYVGGWDTIGNLVSLKKCIEVGSDEYSNEGIPFIRVSNLSSFEITEEKYISEKLYSELTPKEESDVTFETSKNHQPRKDEILFSKDATPGIAYLLIDEPQKMIPSGGILRLKIKDKRIKPSYLTLVLNFIIVQEQIDRDVGGSVILHWRPDQVEQTLIPILIEDKQDQIQQKIIESFNLRKQSKHLLECAKKAVEMVIEKNEETAMKWLKSQLDGIGMRNQLTNIDDGVKSLWT
jgi:restriction endonuclease S subunit